MGREDKSSGCLAVGYAVWHKHAFGFLQLQTWLVEASWAKQGTHAETKAQAPFAMEDAYGVCIRFLLTTHIRVSRHEPKANKQYS